METMDVLRPPLIWIGNRCYRKNPVKQSDVNTAEEEEDYTSPVHDNWNDELCDVRVNIEETEDGYRIQLEIPSEFFKFIIGKKAETKKRLETETRTQIRIPKAGLEGPIVIVGHDRQGVISAKTRIDLMVDSARQRMTFTHFLSLPIIGENIKDKFEEFKLDVLRECDGDRGLDDTIFQNCNKLHLTIGTMVLLNDREVEKAQSLLDDTQTDLVEPILKGTPLNCRIKGLEYMNDDPGEVDVLYAKIQFENEESSLQILADRIVDKFTSSSIMQRGFDNVKLHITVMNTLMRKDPSGTSIARNTDRRGGDRESFDAHNILKKFGNYDFGSYTIPAIHISEKHYTDKNGYYACSGYINLPT